MNRICSDAEIRDSKKENLSHHTLVPFPDVQLGLPKGTEKNTSGGYLARQASHLRLLDGERCGMSMTLFFAFGHKHTNPCKAMNALILCGGKKMTLQS